MTTTETIESAPKRSPWGPVQSSHRIAEGIWTVSTSGHGGIRLSADRVRAIKRAFPAAVREASEDGAGIWWEEDCACNWPRLAFPGAFDTWIASRGYGENDWSIESARSSVRRWFPLAACESDLGPTPNDYADALQALLMRGNTLDGLTHPLEARKYSAHVLGGTTRDPGRVGVQISVGKYSLGFWGENGWNRSTFLIDNDRGTDPFLVALEACMRIMLLCPVVTARLDALIGGAA